MEENKQSMETYNIGFSCVEGGVVLECETQFDVEYNRVITDLMELFANFCVESGFTNVKVSYVERVTNDIPGWKRLTKEEAEARVREGSWV